MKLETQGNGTFSHSNRTQLGPGGIQLNMGFCSSFYECIKAIDRSFCFWVQNMGRFAVKLFDHRVAFLLVLECYERKNDRLGT